MGINIFVDVDVTDYLTEGQIRELAPTAGHEYHNDELVELTLGLERIGEVEAANILWMHFKPKYKSVDDCREAYNMAMGRV